MKKMLMTLMALLTMSAAANAMSYEQARNEALFLTDKMAYELDLTDEQYEAAYEINLDYLMGVTSPDDVYGVYWERRNLDMSYILYSWQWEAFRAATYFFRPLYWNAGRWHFGVYARYTVRDYFYFGRPTFYVSYRGGHAWHVNGGRSYYYGRRDHFRPAINDRHQHFGMRQRFDNHHGNHYGSSTRITAGNRNHDRGYGNDRNGRFGNDRNGRYDNNRNGRYDNNRNGRYDNNRNDRRDRNGSYGNERPTTGNDRPTTGNRNFGDRPTTGNDRPTTGNDRPTTGNRRPGIGNDRPLTNRNFGNDRPTGADRPTGNMGNRQNFNSGNTVTLPSQPSTTTRPSTSTTPTTAGRHFGSSGTTTTTRPSTTTTTRPSTTMSDRPTRSFGGNRSSSVSSTRSTSTPSRSFSSGSSSNHSSSASRSFGSSSHSSSNHSSASRSSAGGGGGGRSHFGGSRR